MAGRNEAGRVLLLLEVEAEEGGREVGQSSRWWREAGRQARAHQCRPKCGRNEPHRLRFTVSVVDAKNSSQIRITRASCRGVMANIFQSRNHICFPRVPLFLASPARGDLRGRCLGSFPAITSSTISTIIASVTCLYYPTTTALTKSSTITTTITAHSQQSSTSPTPPLCLIPTPIPLRTCPVPGREVTQNAGRLAYDG
ncbi:hypothetical protein E2C01_022334 [Portunus trituberculatus]|uniref:Uncharacterized protein n=1 Tax=Portunus trituberculatus TaxID=210409 RepID=A0A5B7E703_PORTR|nr:hypothetical protein [Portunus trituberculatus]